MNIIDAFAFGLGFGVNIGLILVLFVDTLENAKNAVLDIIGGYQNE